MTIMPDKPKPWDHTAILGKRKVIRGTAGVDAVKIGRELAQSGTEATAIPFELLTDLDTSPAIDLADFKIYPTPNKTEFAILPVMSSQEIARYNRLKATKGPLGISDQLAMNKIDDAKIVLKGFDAKHDIIKTSDGDFTISEILKSGNNTLMFKQAEIMMQMMKNSGRKK